MTGVRGFRAAPRRGVVVGVVSVLIAMVVLVPEPPVGAVPQVQYAEHFGSDNWWTHWQAWDGTPLTAVPWHTDRVTDLQTHNTFLRVSIVGGTHEGSSFHMSTGTADEVWLTYRVRFGPTFSPVGTAIKNSGGFGKIARGDGACLYACGGHPSNGENGYSVRVTSKAPLNSQNFYVYDADMQPGPDGSGDESYGTDEAWDAQLGNGAWHTVREHIRMNTPGQTDGVLDAWVDGTKVCCGAKLWKFRNVDSMHVTTVWMNWHYGGDPVAPPGGMYADIDDITIEY
jgi:hypothetical protein